MWVGVTAFHVLYVYIFVCIPASQLQGKYFSLIMHTIKYITALHVASCTHLYMQERTFALIIHIRMFLAPCSIYARQIFPLYSYVYNQVHYCSACCFMYTIRNNICSDYTYWLPAPFMQGNYFSLIICIFLPPTLLHRAGYDTRVYVEGLHVTGSVQAVVTLDYEAPFPHVASITATFVRK